MSPELAFMRQFHRIHDDRPGGTEAPQGGLQQFQHLGVSARHGSDHTQPPTLQNVRTQQGGEITHGCLMRRFITGIHTCPDCGEPTIEALDDDGGNLEHAQLEGDERVSCNEGAPMTVRFYDAGQALAALVTLPDGRHIMIDAGEAPDRATCGTPCQAWHQRVREGLARDLGQDAVEMMWITHQHADHLGGVPGLAELARPKHYVDNGTDLTTRGVKKARAAATAGGAAVHVVDPSSPALPMQGDERVTLTPILPARWPANCKNAPNDCSIGLRIDYCRSSVLFVGDAEAKLEAAWSVEDVDLLQVGHHGSETSSTQRFIDRVQPDYAVVSCGDPREGTNSNYCHPRLETIDRLTALKGKRIAIGPEGSGTRPLKTRKLSAGRSHSISTRAGSSKYSTPLAATPTPTQPAQARPGQRWRSSSSSAWACGA